MRKIFDWEFLLREDNTFLGRVKNVLECKRELRNRLNNIDLSISLCINDLTGIFYVVGYSKEIADDIQKYLMENSIQEIEEV